MPAQALVQKLPQAGAMPPEEERKGGVLPGCGPEQQLCIRGFSSAAQRRAW
jgi:hypothetical protein